MGVASTAGHVANDGYGLCADVDLVSLALMSSPPGRASLLLGCFLAFLLIGAQQAMYGPSFDSFQARYGVSASQVSLLVSLHFFGSFLTIAGSGVLLALIGYRPLLTASALLLAVGAFLLGATESWPLALTAALVAGLGFGSLNVGVSLLLVRSFASRVAPALNLFNAVFGLGAVLGPLLIGLTVPAVGRAFLVMAALAMIVFVLMLRIAEPERAERSDGDGGVAWARAAGFVLVYFLYVSAEVGAASWEATQLEPHLGPARAATLTALFWAAVTVGRIVAVPVSLHLRPSVLVLGAVALALLAASLTTIVPIAPYAYTLLGLAFAPIFPSVLAWLSEAFPHRAEQVAPIAIAGANLGPVVTAPLIGAAVDAAGTSAIPYALLSLTGALLLAAGLLYRATRMRG